MKITITDSKPYCWYVDAIEKEFDAHLRIHPTFGHREYILSNTNRNREYFKGDKCSLLILELGQYGVLFLDATTEQKYDEKIYEHERQVEKELDDWYRCDPNFKD